MANPNEWSQFYNSQQSFFTTTATTTNVTPTGDARLSPETGRVSKPARRRSRASRRTPTTLLNTDTANFRAMVQQFTGGPSAMAFGSGSAGFSLTSSANPAGGGGGIGVQQPPWQYPYHQQPHAPPPPRAPYMFSLGNLNPNMSPNAMTVVGGVNTGVPDEFGMADEAGGGGRGGSAPSSQIRGSRNGNNSWLQ